MKIKSCLLQLKATIASILLCVYLGDALKAQTTNLMIPPEKWEGLTKEIEKQNLPILFNGKVIDQDGKPLPGALVIMRVQRVHFSPQYLAVPEYVRSERTTDMSGRFSLNNLTGKGVEIVSLRKTEYELEPNANRDYGPAGGSIDSPMIFKMWNTNIHEHLIEGKKAFYIAADGTPYVIDLNKGSILQSDGQDGDLRIWIKISKQITQRDFEWSCRFEVINGGLSEEKDSSSSMYRAPVDGYTNVFTYSHKINERWERPSGTIRFFLRLKDGAEYGRCSVDMDDYLRIPKPGPLYFDYTINPTSSRNLR